MMRLVVSICPSMCLWKISMLNHLTYKLNNTRCDWVGILILCITSRNKMWVMFHKICPPLGNRALKSWALKFPPPPLKPWTEILPPLRKPRRLTFFHRNQVRPTGFEFVSTGIEFDAQDRSSSLQKLSSSHRIGVHFYRNWVRPTGSEFILCRRTPFMWAELDSCGKKWASVASVMVLKWWGKL